MYERIERERSYLEEITAFEKQVSTRLAFVIKHGHNVPADVGVKAELAAAVEHIRNTGMLFTQPLCGGLPPELAWPCLELLVEEVLPVTSDDP